MTILEFERYPCQYSFSHLNLSYSYQTHRKHCPIYRILFHANLSSINNIKIIRGYN